jgi:hypothetical protein
MFDFSASHDELDYGRVARNPTAMAEIAYGISNFQ